MSVGTLWCGAYRCAALGSRDLETPVLIWRGGSWYMRSRVPRFANMRGLGLHDLGRALLGGSRVVRVEVASGEGFSTSLRHDSDQVKSLVAGPSRALHSFLPPDRLLHTVDEPASHPPSSRPLPLVPIDQPPFIFPAAIGRRVYPQYHLHLHPESRRPIPRPGPSDFLRGVAPTASSSLHTLISTSLVPHTKLEEEGMHGLRIVGEYDDDHRPLDEYEHDSSSASFCSS
ncbi:hypothetical protein MSAN_01744100 [Mycena sanguinolenta]|uniref:Uncharacterized protein n=1 Tax=Mycena sanguinolenta TaxID=230812 RepID=A0A8H6Y0B8_9AGAR|nr:hypothetical protein MSAN_01744100 [Mycena sanguinolenta]